eukprot:GHVT01042976.1.p1 GENE.GHVT01042976.1~~GHVT01042976.1.p1  ORF type:complete len:155 (+),score=35.56 GHVT01042976.1:49-465(+)
MAVSNGSSASWRSCGSLDSVRRAARGKRKSKLLLPFVISIVCLSSLFPQSHVPNGPTPLHFTSSPSCSLLPFHFASASSSPPASPPPYGRALSSPPPSANPLYLKDLILSEGVIAFRPDVFHYEVRIHQQIEEPTHNC